MLTIPRKRPLMARDDMDDEEQCEEREARRPAVPRFGPFVTIAAAILLLFGAASRVGKTPEDGGWLNFDFLTAKSLENERLRRQEQRTMTLITLGAIPAADPAQAPARSVRLQEDALPPQRDVDFHTYQEELERRRNAPAPLSLRMPLEDNQDYDAPAGATHFDPAPEAPAQPAPASRAGTYVVAQGDNWVKIGKHVGKKWQDIQQANPQARDGLRVGMKLTIP